MLGISAFYHDSAAAILVDGEIVAAAQEERFSRVKHDASFPSSAVAFCLEAAGCDIESIDYVVFYEKPFLKLERILESYLACSPHGYGSFRKAIPVWLKEKLYQPRMIRSGLKNRFDRRLIFVQHHQSHAACTFFTSPFAHAAILTADGVGEWATTTIGQGDLSSIKLSDELRFPDSLGLLYSAFTAFCGFHVNGGEGKLMGLAPLGKPQYVDVIFENLIDLKPDGSFRLNGRFFDFVSGSRITNTRFEKLFDGPPRVPESAITDREKNLAASIQIVTESILLKIAQHLRQRTGQTNLCFAGGVALNCVANERIRSDAGFENVWIQPAAGDAGGAIGAALFAWHQLLGNVRNPSGQKAFAPFLGPVNSPEVTRQTLDDCGIIYESFDSSADLAKTTASLLADQKTIAWVQGGMEFGPRALGNRSILADPRDAAMQDRINETIKRREGFRPFAPVILEHRVAEFFQHARCSPYMLFVDQLKDNAILPATTHVDGSARVQTVSCLQNERLFELLSAFEKSTGCPALLNTSFNLRGEPLINSTLEAIQGFLRMKIDALVIGDFLIRQGKQSNDAFDHCQALIRASQADEIPKKNFCQRILDFLKTVTFPIHFVVSELLLILTFGLFAIIGVVVRLTGRDSFRPIDPELETYWRERDQCDDEDRYFKQF